MRKNVCKTETLHLEARWGKLFIRQKVFLTNFCLLTTRLLINLHEKKVWNRLLFFGATEEHKSGTNCYRFKQKKTSRDNAEMQQYSHMHTLLWKMG